MDLLSPVDSLDDPHQFRQIHVFEHVPGDPRFYGLAHLGRGVVEGEHQDLGAGQALVDQPRGADAVEVGHGQIHEDDVGLVLFGQHHGLQAVRRRAHDLDLRVQVQDFLEALAQETLILGDEHADTLGLGHGPRRRQRRGAQGGPECRRVR